MIELCTPISANEIDMLQIGDMISISGTILTGRDTALPRLVELIKRKKSLINHIDFLGGVMFHTAVSSAGVGPTSSNKPEIEDSIMPLSMAGIRLHLGKGEIHAETIKSLCRISSVYAVIPPVTALLESKTLQRRVVLFPELGMEAIHELRVDHYPAVIAVAHGESVY